MHVDFFVVGAQKSGTTALDQMLRRHSGIQMATSKEPHFFDDEARDWTIPDYEALRQHFDWSVDGVRRGEATPIYCYWPDAIERLKSYNPHAKLIMGLRHPAWRAFSHWRMETTNGFETLSFAEAIRDGRRRVAAAPGGVHRVHSYIERGFYAAQAARLLKHFPRSRIFFFRTDHWWRRPAATLAALQSFLEVSPAPLAQAPEYVVPLQSNDLGAPAATDLSELAQLFESDIKATSLMIGAPLDDWLDPDYREPMQPG